MLYIVAARRWLNNASDFIAWIARVTLPAQESDSRSGCCDVVRSGGRVVVLPSAPFQWCAPFGGG
jgi:hypothetical protein